MLGLIFMILVVFASLAVLFWAGALFTQGYIYSEPEPDLYWRAPAAAAILSGFLGFWCFLNYQAAADDTIQAPYGTLFQFNPAETRIADKLWSVRGEQEELYNRLTTGEGRIEYVNAQGAPWRREDSNGIVEAIAIEENGSKVRFEPRLTQGKFAADAGQYPPYYEKGGRRVMEPLGQITLFRWGQFLLNLLLNLVHFGLWFVCLWLLIRFQWTHALFGAVVIWLTVTLAVLPMLLDQSLAAGRLRASPGSALRLGTTVRDERRAARPDLIHCRQDGVIAPGTRAPLNGLSAQHPCHRSGPRA